jgi:hypothetical protein
MLDNAFELVSQRHGARTITVGTPWLFGAGSVVQIVGPRGELRVRAVASAEEQGAARRLVATPEDAGRYRVTIDKQTEQRFVTLDSEELQRVPIRAKGQLSSLLTAPTSEKVDASRTVAWSLMGLLGAELALRGIGRWRAHAARRAGRAVRGKAPA